MDFKLILLIIVPTIFIFILLIFADFKADEKQLQKDILLCMEATNQTEAQCRYELRLAEKGKSRTTVMPMPVYIGK